MHKHLINKIIAEGNTVYMDYLRDISIDSLDELKIYNYPIYKNIICKLYKMVYGNHLSEEIAKDWVKSMKNKDGTQGEHWSIEQTNQYAGQHNKYDWYVAMNMAYSDYYSVKFDTNVYVELANDFINDKDAKDNKLIEYYFHVVCEK